MSPSRARGGRARGLRRITKHPLVPEVAWQVEVRLDDGSAVTVTHEGARRYKPGERVRVLLDEAGALLL